MDLKMFKEVVKEPVIPTIIEIEGRLFPKNAIQTLPLYYLAFEQDNLELYQMNSFFQKKNSEPLLCLRYDQIDSVELGISQKMGIVYSSASENTYLTVQIVLKDQQSLIFECEDVSVAAQLSQFLEQQHISLIDPLRIVFYFQQNESYHETVSKLLNTLNEKS
ncbi:hypothetical protein [Globicatella sanguinis]